MNSFAIIGTGVIGGYVAIKLHEAGFTVHCLLRSDYCHVKKHGLSLISDHKKIISPVNAYQNIQDMPQCDAVLVALKTTENHLLKEMLPKVMGPDTQVALLQNGIGVEKEIAEFIDPQKIIGASCMLMVSKDSPGTIRHYGFNTIELAQSYTDEQQEGVTDQVKILAEVFKRANIDSKASSHLPTMRWRKLAGNIPANGLSVVLNASTQELVQNPESYELLCEMTKVIIF